MSKAKKLPSGRWRVRVSIGWKYKNGRKVRDMHSFTAATRKEAEYLAAQFIYTEKDAELTDLPFSMAAQEYINSRSEILSPASIRKYETIRKNLPQSFTDTLVSQIDNELIQTTINDVASTRSAKTVRDYHGFISAVLKYSGRDLYIHTKLPQKRRVERHIPTDEDISKIISTVKDTDMELPVYLAAFGTFRRGEISALQSEDVLDDRVHIHRTMVLDQNNRWVTKQPKSYAGDRYVKLPEFVMDMLHKRHGNITGLTPNKITSKFEHICNQAGVKHFRFHDLRHYCASVAHALGVPDAYVMSIGGWGNDRVLKDVYRHAFSDVQDSMEEKMNEHFKTLADGDESSKG